MGEANVQTQAQAAYWMSCTSQAQCRSEPVSYYGASSAPLVNVESRLPAASGGEVTARSATQGFGQQLAEMPVGSPDDGVQIGAGAAFPLADHYHSEAWWAQLNVHSAMQQNAFGIGRNPSVVSTDIVPFSSGSFSMDQPRIVEVPGVNARLEKWCPDTSAHPVAVDVEPIDPSSEDLNAVAATPSDPPASALATVSTEVVAAGIPQSPSASPPLAANCAPVLPEPAPAGPPRAGEPLTEAASRKGKSVSAPTSPSELRTDKTLAVHKSKSSVGKRPLSERQKHIRSERQRREGLNDHFDPLRSLLPHPSPTNKTDKSTVVGEIIKCIQTLQMQQEVLTRKQQQMAAARALISGNASVFQATLPLAFVSNGVTLADHSSHPTSLTAVTALPSPGRDSRLHSCLGVNVGLHVSGLNVRVTASSPRGRRGLFRELLVTLQEHSLDVINANISTSSASIFHSLHCQASRGAELNNNYLHNALQSVIRERRGRSGYRIMAV